MKTALLLCAICVTLTADDQSDPLAAFRSGTFTDATVSAAFREMGTHRGTPAVADLYQAVARILAGNESGPQKLALSALTAAPFPEFDADLADLLPAPAANFGDQADLLGAIAKSGGSQCIASLKVLASAPSMQAHRAEVIRVLAPLAPDAAVHSGLEAIAMDEHDDFAKDDALRDAVLFSFRQAQEDRDSLVRTLTQFAVFLAYRPAARPLVSPTPSAVPPPIAAPVPANSEFDPGAPASNRYRIYQGIENVLLSMKSPGALALLLRFRLSKDPVLANAAAGADFSPLQKTPWLIPCSLFPYLGAGVAGVGIAGMANILVPVFSAPGEALPNSLDYMDTCASSALYQTVQAKTAGDGNFSATSPAFLAGRTEQIEMAGSVTSAVLSALNLIPPHSVPPQPAALAGKPNAVPTPAVSNPLTPYDPTVRYRSLGVVTWLSRGAIAAALGRAGTPADTAMAAAAFLTSRELERRALVAEAILLARRRRGLPAKNVKFGDLDTELDALSAIREPGVVDTGIDTTLLTPSSSLAVKPPFPDACRNVTLTVRNRRISAAAEMFTEMLDYSCAGGESGQFQWSGPVPLFLRAPLLRHIRLLDFGNNSLAQRDLFTIVTAGRYYRSDLDLAISAPELNIPRLLYAISDPSITPADVRDLMLDSSAVRPGDQFGGWDLSSFWQVPPLKRRVTGANPSWLKYIQADLRWTVEAGIPPGLVTFGGVIVWPTAARYQERVTQLQHPIDFFWKNRLALLTLQGQMDVVRRTVPDKDPCKDMDFLCDVGLLQSDNTNKQATLNSYSRDIAVALDIEKAMEPWNLDGINMGAITRVDAREIAVSPDFTEAVGLYELEDSKGVVRFVQRKLSLQGLPRYLRRLAWTHPEWLMNYAPDFGLSTADAQQRLLGSAERFYRMYDDRSSSSLLALVFGLGDVSAAGVRNAAPGGIGNLPAPPAASPLVAAVPSVIKGSAVADAWALELKTIGTLVHYVADVPVPPSGKPGAGFVADISAQWRSDTKSIADRAATEHDRLFNLMRSGGNSWSVGVSLTVGTPFPIVSFGFSRGGTALSFSTAPLPPLGEGSTAAGAPTTSGSGLSTVTAALDLPGSFGFGINRSPAALFGNPPGLARSPLQPAAPPVLTQAAAPRTDLIATIGASEVGAQILAMASAYWLSAVLRDQVNQAVMAWEPSVLADLKGSARAGVLLRVSMWKYTSTGQLGLWRVFPVGYGDGPEQARAKPVSGPQLSAQIPAGAQFDEDSSYLLWCSVLSGHLACTPTFDISWHPNPNQIQFQVFPIFP